MTQALYDRIDAIERFAADVAHELKNPLTSLRSAVEMLERTKDDSRERRCEDAEVGAEPRIDESGARGERHGLVSRFRSSPNLAESVPSELCNHRGH